MDGALTLKRGEYCSPVDIKMKCVYNYCVQSCVFLKRQFGFGKSTTDTDQYQFIYRLVLIMATNR